MSLFKELKRRNVFRVGIAYVVLCWVLLQVTDVVVPILELPDWVARLVLLLLGLGFPVVLIFAWAFELTPEGIKREKDVDRSQSITPTTGRKLDFTIIGILAVAVVLLVLDRYSAEEPKTAVSESAEPAAVSRSLTETSPGSGEEVTSVAVLPFVNMSDDAQNEYFSDGISEELLNVLVRIEGLRVPSRTSSFTFKGSGKKLSEIGRELGVDHVLEGSVRKAGDRIRVTAQLIDVHSDMHLWSETYTRKLDDIFAVQDEIAQAIVGALKVTLSGEQQMKLSERGTRNVEAYNQYLMGRHIWNQRIPGRMVEAIPPLRRATELDPDFDQAWAALADAYLLLPEYEEGTVAENIPLAFEATAKALALNPASARALTTSAYIKAMHYYQWDEGEREFRQAIELEPAYVTAHQWYAEMLAAQRRTDEALAQLEAAAAADPLAPIIPHIQGWVCLWADRFDEAERYYLAALKLDPGFPYAVSNLGLLYMRSGDYDKARARWTQFWQLVEQPTNVQLLVIDALENPARKDEAIAALQSSTLAIDPFNKPVLYAMLDRYDLTLETILANFETGGPYAVHVSRMLIFDRLRDDPRYQAMLTKMNLWP